MYQRENVRQLFVTAIQTVYAGTVVSSRNIDARGWAEFVNVYLESGEHIYGFNYESATAELVVGVHKQGATDAALDAIGDAIVGAIETNVAIRTALVGVVHTGFSYTADDGGEVNSLTLKFEVRY